MYRFDERQTERIVEARNLAALQLPQLKRSRSDFPEGEALSFLTREILRLYHEGDHQAQRLANRAISHLREHIQKRESTLRLARLSDLD